VAATEEDDKALDGRYRLLKKIERGVRTYLGGIDQARGQRWGCNELVVSVW